MCLGSTLGLLDFLCTSDVWIQRYELSDADGSSMAMRLSFFFIIIIHVGCVFEWVCLSATKEPAA